MSRVLIKSLGYLFLVLAVLGMLTPIPLGIVFFILAMLCLIPTSPWVASRIQRLRRRSHRFDRMMSAIMRRIPSPYRRILKATDVDPMERTHF